MFAISRSLLACHFCFFYLVVFPLNAVHLTFQGHHRYSDEECWTPEWVCVLLSSVYCILSWSFYSSSYLTICVYVPTLQISELLKLLIVVYMLFLPIFCLTHWHFPTTAEGFCMISYIRRWGSSQKRVPVSSNDYKTFYQSNVPFLCTFGCSCESNAYFS